MELKTTNYLEQLKGWPQSGKHITEEQTLNLNV